MKAFIEGLGEIMYYDIKSANGGVYFWLYCKDGVTKMPEPIFIKGGDYELR